MRFPRPVYRHRCIPWMRVVYSCTLLLSLSMGVAQPVLLDDQFQLPPGFHIYKVAERDLTGGSYDLTFDGNGRVLIGDGKNVRRLSDDNQDQVFDTYEVIATGLGGRGPQGLVVYGDHLYAVGGDGVQLFSGYQSGGALKHEGRLGAPFNTGGDHAAHTVLRGLDGYLYLVSGDGGGVGDRKHITEASSPVLNERNASVFRFDPFGDQWECISTGGRNPPSLGMNYLGEFFSFDSDMEWHVDLPFYRPVRLNHWVIGGDQGWQQVGAYPPYYIDCLPAVLEVGRGSPNWGIFYEHVQFPESYHDAFLACDYQWKSATSGSYANPGRLVSFEMKRQGATWSAQMSVLAQPLPDAKTPSNQPIHFAVVDVDVAPDGSLLVSDHNQSIWRLFYDAAVTPEIPLLNALPATLNTPDSKPIHAILNLPQPMAEWSRVAQETRLDQNESRVREALLEVAIRSETPVRNRLRAIRLLAPHFLTLPSEFIAQLARDASPEIRGQAVWLMGIRKNDQETPILIRLLNDRDPFVRRRSAEAFNRYDRDVPLNHLIPLLSDPDRFVRYSAMTAIAHLPTQDMVEKIDTIKNPHALMRLLVASHLRRERASPETVRQVMTRLWAMRSSHLNAQTDTLDFLRVLGLFRSELQSDAFFKKRIEIFLTQQYRDRSDSSIRWELARLLGEYEVGSGFPILLDALESESDGMTQFHFADALSKITHGSSPEESIRFIKWLQSTQKGWFAELDGKGLQFPGFWGTVLTRIAQHHTESLMTLADGLEQDSQLTSVAYKAFKDAPGAEDILLKAFQTAATPRNRFRILRLFEEVKSPKIAAVLLQTYDQSQDQDLRTNLIRALVAQPIPSHRSSLFLEAITELESPPAIESCAQRIVMNEVRPPDLDNIVYGEKNGLQALGFRSIELMMLKPDTVPSMERMLQHVQPVRRPSYVPELQCIWSSDQQITGDRAWFSKVFHIDAKPRQAQLHITCDNEYTVYVNGEEIGNDKDWQRVESYELNAKLKQGRNVIAVAGINQGGPAGLAALLRWTMEDESMQLLASDTSWHVSQTKPQPNWLMHPEESDSWRLSSNVSQPTANVMDVMTPLTETQASSSLAEIVEFWQDWYRQTFHEPFVARRSIEAISSRGNESLKQFLLALETIDGDRARGRQAYIKGSCFACHGGLGAGEGTLFGPTLVGATQRLNRDEFADAIVYPSKHVPERFKSTQVVLKNGTELNGFVTSSTENEVSITDLSNQVHLISRMDIEIIKAQDTSLMPEQLINTFTDQEIRDLLAFIQKLE